MESYQPQPTTYHPNYDADKDDEYTIWPKDVPSPPLKWKNPTPWTHDLELITSTEDLTMQQQILDTLNTLNRKQRMDYQKFKRHLRRDLQDTYPEYYDPESDDFNEYNYAYDNRIKQYQQEPFTQPIKNALTSEDRDSSM